MARKAPKKSTASGDDDEPSCCSGSFLLSQSARADEASAERKEGRWVSSHALGGSGRGLLPAVNGNGSGGTAAGTDLGQ